MTQCCIEGCSGVGKHRFPTNPKMRALWIKAIRRQNLVLKDHTRLCRKHFPDSDFFTNQYHEGEIPRRRLRVTAVPTLFLAYDKHNTDIKHFQTHATPGIIVIENKNQSVANTESKSEELATEQTQFTCNACRASFATRCLLYYHKIYHPYYCNICKKSFKTLRSITIHECTVCPTCEENFTSVAQLINHKNQSKCKKKPEEYCKCCFYCPNCSEQFAVKKNLTQHLEELKFPCQICKKCYRLSEELSAHIQSVHQTKVVAGESHVTGNKDESTDSESEELATEQTQFNCNACRASFATRCLLYYHKIYHPYYCNICKKSFKTLRSITIHKCTVCPICEENFTSVAQLNNHINQLKCKKKPKEYCKCCFYCPNCSEQFAVKKNLIQHLEKLKYPCQICKKCYRLSEELLAHIQSVHQTKVVAGGSREFCSKVWLCSICKAKFNDSAALEAHMRRNIHQVTVIKAGPRRITAKGQSLNTKMKRVTKVEVAVDEVTGAVSRVADIGLNLDTGSQTIGDVAVKKEPGATTAPVWLELQVKKEPIEQPNMDELVELEAVADIGLNLDTGSHTIGDVAVKKEPGATTAPVWLELEVKKEPIEQPNMDELVEVKKEPEWVDVEIKPEGDVIVKEEIMELQMHIKEEPEES